MVSDQNQIAPKAFVIGWPIAHSLSPQLHGYWLKQCGIDGSYEKIAVEPQNINEFISSFHAQGFVGGNITIPHKETVYDLLENCDETAKTLKAVNTLWVKDGKLKATNTDGYGFTANLDDFAPQWRKAKTALVIGAGGASRAIILALLNAGIRNIFIANRTIERAEKLATQMAERCSAHTMEDIEKLLGQTDILINTTALGMKGNEPLELKLENLPESAIVTDVVYNPLRTPLLQHAEKLNLETVDGIGMLLHQAVPGFEKWFGFRPRVTPALREFMLDILKATK